MVRSGRFHLYYQTLKKIQLRLTRIEDARVQAKDMGASSSRLMPDMPINVQDIVGAMALLPEPIIDPSRRHAMNIIEYIQREHLNLKAAERYLIDQMKQKRLDREIVLVYREDNCLTGAVGEMSSVVMTTDEIERLYAGQGDIIILTHNHPQGRPFSQSDLVLFLRSKANEIHAVTEDYIFIARKTKLPPGKQVGERGFDLIRFPVYLDPIQFGLLEKDYYWGHSLRMCEILSENLICPFDFHINDASGHPVSRQEFQGMIDYYVAQTEAHLTDPRSHVGIVGSSYTFEERG